jgi:hypothetical protein
MLFSVLFYTIFFSARIVGVSESLRSVSPTGCCSFFGALVLSVCVASLLLLLFVFLLFAVLALGLSSLLSLS